MRGDIELEAIKVVFRTRREEEDRFLDVIEHAIIGAESHETVNALLAVATKILAR